MINYSPKYKLGQIVYHITPESECGVIVDIVHFARTNEIKYIIAIGFNNEVEALEDEITDTKRYDH